MSQQITLGNAQLDLGSHSLLRDGLSIPIEPVDFRVLLHLISKAPDHVRSDTLLRQNWPNSIVTDNSLHQVIRRLRQTLGDDARRPQFIQTLPKVGYRLIADVRDSSNLNNGRALDISPLLVTRFSNYSPDATNSYVTEGLMYEIRQHLAIAQLEVIDQDRIAGCSVASVADAKTILAGAVAHQAGRLRVNASLTDTESSRLIWSQTFDVEDECLFDAHSIVGRQIVDSMTTRIHRSRGVKRLSSADSPVSLQLWRENSRQCRALE